MATTTRRLPKVANYVKNVGKSLAFASIDAVKKNATGISDFLDSNEDILKESYASVKNYRDSMRRVNRTVRQTKMFTAVEAGLKNMIEDAKSGNFYNDARVREVSEAALGLDDDFGFDDDSNDSYIDDNMRGAKIVSDSFDRAIGAAATSQALAVSQGTELVIKTNITSTKMIVGQIDRVSSSITAGMGSVYSAIDRVNQFLTGPMHTHLENSKLYYENSSKLMQEQAAMMKELLEMQRNLYKAQQTSSGSSKFNDSISFNGAPNITGYAKTIKKNVKEMMDGYGLGMGGMDIGGGNPYLLYAAAPFKMVLEPLMQQMLSKDLKKAIKSFDKGLTTMFSQAIARLNKHANDGDGGIMSILAQVFGVRLNKKDTINTANYEKGPVPFDGITRKTINEVIPGYLARIEAALTGSGERHYDAYTGTWKSAKQIEREFKQEKANYVASANTSARYELQGLINQTSSIDKKAADQLSKKIDTMFMKIYDDGGAFKPEMGKNPNKIEQQAWKYYGFDKKEDFDNVMKYLSKDSIRDMAYNNMRARESHSAKMREYEARGGAYNILFNGTYDSKGEGRSSSLHGASGYSGGSGLLAISKDREGKNVFWYLREILNTISRNYRAGNNRSSDTRPNGPSGGSGGRYYDASSESSSDDSEGDGDDDGDIPQSVWDEINRQNEEAAEERAKKNKAGNWLKDKLGKTKVGKKILEGSTAVSRLLAKPMEYMTKMLNKADESMFKMMFGENDYKDDEGNPIGSVFDYIIYKIKNSFKDLTNFLKEKIFNPLKDFIKPIWEKYGKPIVDEVKGYASKGFNRVKKGVGNTFGKGFSRLKDILKGGGVVGADDAEAAANEEGTVESASGRFVTKRGLTMISPGEIIIPSTFDKAGQARQLALEKRDKKRIFDAIGYNAKGNVDTDKIKETLRKMYEENKGKGKKAAAGGILGAGAGMITGINPIIGALAGSALSFVTESDTFKDFLFGKDRDGSGAIPKKVYDVFKKSGSDMLDFGIAGGIAGLFTPFGILGGAAMGAGIGFLKNNESFKKFIFGDAETGKDGLIKKETYDKFVKKAKKSVPNIAIGAALGALTGPFGLLGNAAMGAGLGMLTATDKFQNFVLGEKGEDGKRHGGLAGSFKESVIEPAKEKMTQFLDSLKDYAKKNILDPMKRFWEPFQDAIKNTITSVGDRVKDHLNDTFEKTLGIPMKDFLQQKVFKPLSRVMSTLVKIPITVGKAVVAAPFRALGAIGDSMRMGQIQRGTAYGMSAKERLAFRDKHQYRNALGTALGRDKTYEQDQLLANMSDDDLLTLFNQAGVQLNSREEISRQVGQAREAVGGEISKFFNTKTGPGKNLYDKFGYKNVTKLTEYAAEGRMDKVQEMLKKDKTLTTEEKNTLLNNISDKVSDAGAANKRLAMAGTDEAVRDMELQRVLGRKFRGRKDARKLYRSAEAEIKARRKNAVKDVIEESPEEHATNTLTDLFDKKSTKLIDILTESNNYLKELVNPGSTKKDTTPPGDKNKTTDEGSSSTAASKGVNDVIRGSENKPVLIDPKTGNAITGNPDNKLDVENAEERKKLEAVDKENLESNKESTNILKKTFEKMFGKEKSKDKKEGSGILGKIGSMFGSLSKFLGVGGKAVLAVTGVSLFGYATQWFKTGVWPTIKSALFGTTNDDGTTKNGLLTGVKAALIGDEASGKEGFLQKICGWFGTKFEELKSWYTGKGGISGIIVNDVLPKLITGWGYAVDNVVAPLTALIIKSLPGIAIGLVKGIVSGLKMAIFNKTLTRSSDSTVNISTAETQKEIQDLNKSTSSALESSMGSLGASLKNAFNTGKSSAAYTASNAASIDLSVFTGNDEDTNNKKTGIIDNLLGSTHRTNTLEYDEDGNITTQYTQMNSTDSALSRLAKSSGRGFMNGLSGLTSATSLIGKGLSSIKPGSGIGKGVIGLTTRGATTVANAAGKVMNAATNAGTAIRDLAAKVTGKTVAGAADNVIDATAKFAGNAADNVIDATAKFAANAAESATKKGILSGFKNIFSKIANSALGTKILGWIAKATGTEVTQAVLEKTLLKIAEKLSEKACTKLAGTALKSVATAIAGYSPLGIAFIIYDFYKGYSNADTYLGVAKGDSEYSVGFAQKVLCGLLNIVNQKLTLGLIPTETIVSIIVEYLFPLFKLDTSSLQEAQDRAATIMDEYNEEHGTTYDNLEDFNNKDKITTKIWSGIKKAGTAVGSGIVTASKGMGSTAKNLAANAKTAISGAFNSISDKVGTTVSNTKDIGSFIQKVTSEVIKSAKDPEYHWDINDYISEDDPLGGAKKSIYNVMKPLLGMIGIVSKIGSKISGKIKEFTDKLHDGYDDAQKDLQAVSKGEYSIFNKKYWETNEEDEDNPLGGISKAYSMINRVFNAPGAMVGYIGTKIGQAYSNMVKNVKAGEQDATSDINAVKSGRYTIFNKQYWSSDNTDDNNSLSKLGAVSAFITRLTSAPEAMIGYIGTKIKEGFNKLVSGAKEGSIDAAADIEAVKKGEYTIFNKDYWSSDNDDDDNTLSKIGSISAFLTRLFNAPGAMVGYVGTKIKEGFTNMVNNAKEGALDAKDDIDAVKNGEYTIFNKEYWSSATDAEDDGNPLTKIGTVAAFMTRLVNAPSAMIGYVGTKVKNFFTSMVDSIKDVQEESDAIIEKAEKGDISVFSNEYWKVTDNGSPLGVLGSVVGFIDRLTNAPIVLIKSIFNKIKDKFSGITDWFKKLFGEDAEELDIGSSRSGSGRFSRYGLGHIYQGDASISGMRYGDSTIGDAGCAPVAATNLINYMNGGMTVNKAAKYAESHGMTVPGGGTDIRYFNSILGSQGIPTTNTSNKSNVMSALQKGQPVVMLGTDGAEYPGAPFGANQHFVTARGVDKNGNIIAEDPDLPQSTVVYDKNKMLNSMITSVVTGSKRTRRGKSRRLFGRGQVTTTSSVSNSYSADNLGPNAIINVARSQVGIVERSNNEVKYNHAYYGSNVSGDGYAWCCAFVWWVFNQAGASELFYGGNKTAHCATLMNYHWQAGQKVTTPQAGDVVFFNWNGGSTPQHVGIVTGVIDSNNITSVEGNTSGSGSQSNGGCVMEKQRNMKYIVGFYRPKYPYSYKASAVVDMSKYGDTTDYKDIALNGGQMTGDTVSFANSDTYYGTVSSDSSSSSSTTGTLLSALSNLGTTMVKKLFGENAYNALYGDSSSTSTGTTDSYSFGDSSYTSVSPTESAETIYKYLKSKGYTDYAASGLMGCWQNESGNRADRVEGDYLKSFPGFDTVLASNSALDNYTSGTLFPAYARSNISINKDAYKGSDGHYYPGIGLAQWTGPRGYNLFKYAKDNNADWRDLNTQLGFFSTEDKSRNLMSKLNTATSAGDAAHKALDYYEMYEGYGDYAPSALSKRVNAANSIYSNYAGTGRGVAGNSRAGMAAEALNSRKAYYGGSGSVSIMQNPATTIESTGVDYATFLQTIVTVLMSIADNTALLTKILDVLSDNFNIEIDKSDIEEAHKTTKAKTEAALNELVSRSSSNNRNLSKILNNKDTTYILNAMTAIAKE